MEGGYLSSRVSLQCSEALLGWPGNQEKCSKGHGVGSAMRGPFTWKHKGKVSTSNGLTGGGDGGGDGGGGWGGGAVRGPSTWYYEGKVSKGSGLKRDVVSRLGGPPTGVPLR